MLTQFSSNCQAELKGEVVPKKQEPSFRAGEIRPPSEPEEKERRKPGIIYRKIAAKSPLPSSI
jgi:hypothetical protein